MVTDDLIKNCLALLLGQYNKYRKYAAFLMLRFLLGDGVAKWLLTLLGISQPSLGRSDPERYTPAALAWKKAVLARGKCEKCGATKNLAAHHIERWAERPDLRVDITNGQCLCQSCHTQEHEGEQVYALMLAQGRG